MWITPVAALRRDGGGDADMGRAGSKPLLVIFHVWSQPKY